MRFALQRARLSLNYRAKLPGRGKMKRSRRSSLRYPLPTPLYNQPKSDGSSLATS